MWFRAPLVAIGLAVAVLGTAAPAAQTGSSILAGVVVDAATGRGVNRAAVRLTGRDVVQTRLTDELGRFIFKFIPAGEVTITAQKAGYVDGAFGKRRAAGDGIPLTIMPGLVPAIVRIDLFRPAVISGYVADEGGEPIVGAAVRAVRRELVDGAWQFIASRPDTTDDEGNFRLFDLVPGEYLVLVPAVQVTMPIATLDEIGITGSVTAEVSAVMNTLGPPGANDIVPDSDGANAIIAGRIPPPPDQNGKPAAYRTQYYPGGDRISTATSIVVGPAEHRPGVFFQMLPYPTTRVSGVAVGPNGPARNQVVRLLPIEDNDSAVGNEIAITISGADGSFTFLNVPSGRYQLDARGRSIVTPAVPELVPGPPNGPYLWGRTTLAVEEDPVSDLIVAVMPAPTVAGRVVFESASAKPPARDFARVAVTIAPAGGGRRPDTVKPDASGRFSVEGVVPGDYVVRVATPSGWYQQSITGSGAEADGVIRIAPDAGTAEVVVTLTDRPTRVSGAVRDVRGVVAPGAVVIVQPVGRGASATPDARRARLSRAGWNGLFVIEALPPGEYAISAIDEASFDGWHDPRRLEILRATGARVVVRDGEAKFVDLRIR